MKAQGPKLDIAQFFNGPLDGYAVIEDWRGAVSSRFHMQVQGVREGNRGEVQETLNFTDGRVERRLWHFAKQSDGLTIGTADDIAGEAPARLFGPMLEANYVIKREVDGRMIELDARQRMVLVDANHLMSVLEFRKFGIKVMTVREMFVKK